MLFITYDELVEALKTVPICVNHGDSENTRMVALHPEDAATDIFNSLAAGIVIGSGIRPSVRRAAS